MEVSGFILDENTRPLQGASVSLATKNAAGAFMIGQLLAISDATGRYYANYYDITTDKWLAISFVGYITAMVPVDYVARSLANYEEPATQLTLAAPQDLPGVTTTAKVKPGNSSLYWILGGLALLFIVGKNKK